MKYLILSVAATLVTVSGLGQYYSRDEIKMGSAFRLTAMHQSSDTAQLAVDRAYEEIDRIERLISSWDPNSETSMINNAAGSHAVEVSEELVQLILRCKKLSRISSGYFDISYASIDKVWDFSNEKVEIPDSMDIVNSVALINFEDVLVDDASNRVFLQYAGMKIGFGAIGKGYAANRAKAIMQELGVESGVVNAGGDLISWGTKGDDENWRVGIVNPFSKEEVSLWLDIEDEAVVTSGNYERYHMIEGKRYCHIINPKTGWPCSGLSSVTIICADAELADGLATTVFVLGKEDGLRLINHLDGVEAIMISDSGEFIYSDQLLSYETKN